MSVSQSEAFILTVPFVLLISSSQGVSVSIARTTGSPYVNGEYENTTMLPAPLGQLSTMLELELSEELLELLLELELLELLLLELELELELD